MPSAERRASCFTVIGMICAATFEPKQEKVESAVNTKGTCNVLLFHPASLLESYRHPPTIICNHLPV